MFAIESTELPRPGAHRSTLSVINVQNDTPRDRMPASETGGEKGCHFAQHIHPKGYTRGVTLSLPDRSSVRDGRAGVTLRRVAYKPQQDRGP